MNNHLSINTPALLFPAITLLMLAYTNRFFSLSTLIRQLNQQYKQTKMEEQEHTRKHREGLSKQIHNLRKRLKLIKFMQMAGAVSFCLCVFSMLLVYLDSDVYAFAIFGVSLGALVFSLALSIWELHISTIALEIELDDMWHVNKTRL